MAALLALAVVLVWPPVGPGSASPYDSAGQLEPRSDHAHGAQSSQHQVVIVDLAAACDASAAGCCVMAHCYPGISVDPHDLPLFAGDEGTTAASAVHGAGRDPGMVLPPPRRSPV